jgi:hypothetical protein
MRISTHVLLSVLLAAGSVFVHTPAFAQITLNSAGVSAGVIDRLESTPSGANVVFYPEVQVGGRFISPFLEWSAACGYWNDRISGVQGSDYEQYSAQGLILSGRVIFVPQLADANWVLPVAVIGGISHHFISEKFIGGSSWVSGGHRDGAYSTNALEGGLRVFLNVTNSIQLRAEGVTSLGLGDDLLAKNTRGRTVLTAGIAFSI